MLQDVVSLCEKDKNTVFYDVSASRAQQAIIKTLFKNKIYFQKLLMILASFFPAVEPPTHTHVKTQPEWRILGGRAVG